MKLLIIFTISAVLLQYHIASSKQSLADVKIPPLPKILADNYDVYKVIGTGGFGIVILAKHIATGKYVAIKIIDKTQKEMRDHPELMKNEVDNMKGLDHPNIVTLYETAETDLDLFIVMEYISGGELYDYLYKPARKMKEDEARAIFRRLVSAVEYLDYKKIVHRDLKPENVLLDRKGNILLTDFGFSVKFKPKLPLYTFRGSPCYAAPEVLQGKPYIGPYADVWSLGVILDEMLMGSVPFDGIKPVEIIRSIEKGYRAPSTLSKDCKDLLYRIFAVDSENRFNPEVRIKIKDIMDHPWMNIGYENVPLKPHLETELSSREKDRINELLLKGYNQTEINKAIPKADYRDKLFAEYLLLGGKCLKAPASAY